MRNLFGELSETLDINCVLVDSHKYQKQKGRGTVVGYAFVSSVPLDVPVAPMTDKKYIYRFDKNNIGTRHVEAGKLIYLTPIETALLLTRKEYNGIICSGELVSKVTYKVGHANGDNVAYFLRFYNINGSSIPLDGNVEVLDIWGNDDNLRPCLGSSWDVLSKSKEPKCDKDTQKVARHNKSMEQIRGMLGN